MACPNFKSKLIWGMSFGNYLTISKLNHLSFSSSAAHDILGIVYGDPAPMFAVRLKTTVHVQTDSRICAKNNIARATSEAITSQSTLRLKLKRHREITSVVEMACTTGKGGLLVEAIALQCQPLH